MILIRVSVTAVYEREKSFTRISVSAVTQWFWCTESTIGTWAVDLNKIMQIFRWQCLSQMSVSSCRSFLSDQRYPVNVSNNLNIEQSGTYLCDDALLHEHRSIPYIIQSVPLICMASVPMLRYAICRCMHYDGVHVIIIIIIIWFGDTVTVTHLTKCNTNSNFNCDVICSGIVYGDQFHR